MLLFNFVGACMTTITRIKIINFINYFINICFCQFTQFIEDKCFKALNDCRTALFIQVMPNGEIPSIKPKWPPRAVVTKTVFSFFSNCEYGNAVGIRNKY